MNVATAAWRSLVGKEVVVVCGTIIVGPCAAGCTKLYPNVFVPEKCIRANDVRVNEFAHCFPVTARALFYSEVRLDFVAVIETPATHVDRCEPFLHDEQYMICVRYVKEFGMCNYWLDATSRHLNVGAHIVFCVEIGTVVHESLNGVDAPRRDCRMEWCLSMEIGNVDRGASSNELVDNLRCYKCRAA